MSMILLLLDLFIKPQPPKAPLNRRVLGCLLLLIAAGVGLFFLFHALVPVVGYLESGTIICGVLAFMGLGFLFFPKGKPKPGPIDELMETAKAAYKEADIDFEEMFKKHTPTILIASFVAGFALYQMTAVKKNTPAKK